MTRIVLVAVLIASALAFARNQDVLDRTSLLGGCSALDAPAPEGGQWLACRPGKLTGYPDLSQDSCTREGLRGEVRYWRCPTALVGGRSSDETPTR